MIRGVYINNVNHIDDKEMIRRIGAGETESFAWLVDRYGTQLFSLIQRIVRNREDAEELTQDVLLKVFECIGTYRGDSSFSTWLYRIAYNKAVSKRRKKRREQPFGDDTVFRSADSSGEGYDLERERRLRRMEKAMTALPVGERMMLEMYYYEEKSVEELAYITGLSQSNVKVRLFRIRKKMYEDIADDGKEIT